jgi:flavodoxin
LISNPGYNSIYPDPRRLVAMKAVLVYDSIFGNTEKIAKAIGHALETQGEVELMRVADAQPEQLHGVDLVIVGSPTRAFRPTPAIQQYLDGIPSAGLKGTRVAAFDTRIDVQLKSPLILKILAGIFGYAAKPIAEKLIKRGGVLATPSEGFIVLDSEGPLKEGELERAAQWAKACLAG